VQTIIPTKKQKDKARELAKEMGHIRNSITKGEGNFAGFLAEVVVADMLGVKRSPTKDYDLTLDDGRTVDVKTKRTTVAPKPYYDCSIAATSTHQDCDMYIFTRYIEGGALYVLGDCSKDDYFNRARLLKRGDKDGDNGFVVRADCYNLPISELTNLVV
jgi:hypothetical protein